MHKVHPEESHLVTSLATHRNNSSPESVPIHQTSTEESNKEQAPNVPPQTQKFIEQCWSFHDTSSCAILYVDTLKFFPQPLS